MVDDGVLRGTEEPPVEVRRSFQGAGLDAAGDDVLRDVGGCLGVADARGDVAPETAERLGPADVVSAPVGPRLGVIGDRLRRPDVVQFAGMMIMMPFMSLLWGTGALLLSARSSTT